jgi:hypothetical protein
MAEVVNLRTARKQRKRAEKRHKAPPAAPGVAAAEAERARAVAVLERRKLEGHRLPGDEPER